MSFNNLFLSFFLTSIFFSVFVVRTDVEMSILMFIFGSFVFGFYCFIGNSFFKDLKNRKKIVGIPIPLFIYFIIGLIFSVKSFINTFNSGDQLMRASGFSLSFHVFLAIIAAIIAWNYKLVNLNKNRESN